MTFLRLILLFQVCFFSPFISIGRGSASSTTLVFSGRGSAEIIEGNETLAEDYYYPNLTITTDSLIGEVTLTGFQSESGIVYGSRFFSSPFFTYESTTSPVIKWWPYWLNTTVLDFLFINQSFDLHLNGSVVRLIAFCYNISNPLWEWEFDAFLTQPLPTILTSHDAGGWCIHGDHNGTAGSGQFTSRSLNLLYDSQGWLLRLSTSSYFRLVNNSYEYVVVWQRIALKEVHLSFWDLLLVPANVLFGIIILCVLFLGLIFLRLKRDK